MGAVQDVTAVTYSWLSLTGRYRGVPHGITRECDPGHCMEFFSGIKKHLHMQR